MNDFDQLFVRYIAEMRGALAAAREWWAELEKRERKKFASKAEAEASLEARWPFGPPSHPWVLGVFRKYYLLTEQLSQRNAAQAQSDPVHVPEEADWGAEETDPTDLRLEEDESPFTGMTEVAPWILLIDSVLGRDDDLSEALEYIVYRPVGLDANDNVV